MSNLTERDIQLMIREYHGRSSIVIPNIPWFGYYWECDILHVTKSGHFHEYEIKLSRSDFLADKKKQQKHFRLQSGEQGPTLFWYVCPTGLISPDEVPEYAGLIYVVPNILSPDHLFFKKQAPRANKPRRLHSDDWKKLAYFGQSRYWSAAKKLSEAVSA